MKDVLLSKFRLSLLARFELTGPEGPVELPNKKLACLLAYLACTAPCRSVQRLARRLRTAAPRPPRTTARLP
jgi:hypothetical protein